MKAVELREDDSIIDDILADFPQFKKHGDHPPAASFTPQPSSARDPISIRGIDHNSFAQWLRSKEEVRKAIQQHLNTTKMTVKNCIALYTEYNMKIDDHVVLHFRPEDVHPYREYDRKMVDGWTGKLTSEEFTKLMKDIGKKGIEHPGIIEIAGSGADYEVKLGEGNHRLRIAEKLGLEIFPLSFSYSYR